MPKPRPKHSIKVHVWAGISARGATKIYIFEGIMDAEFYTQILGRHLVPFIREIFPSGSQIFARRPKAYISHSSELF